MLSSFPEHPTLQAHRLHKQLLLQHKLNIDILKNLQFHLSSKQPKIAMERTLTRTLN